MRIIWDWNGTLLDDVDICNEILNIMLSERNIGEVGRERYKKIFRFPVIDYYRDAGFNFDKEPYEVLADEFIRLYDEKVKSCPLANDCKKLLSALKSAGIEQSVLSATRQKDLLAQIEQKGVSGYFDEIIGMSDIYAYGKLSAGLAWAEKHSGELEESFFIGDTTHDYEVAKAMGVNALMVASGHHSAERLRECGAPVFDDLSGAVEYMIGLVNGEK